MVLPPLVFPGKIFELNRIIICILWKHPNLKPGTFIIVTYKKHLLNFRLLPGSGSTMVNHLTAYPEIKGLTATALHQEKMADIKS